ncbi:SAM-dependent methyltransferase [Nocardia sp. NPDC049707]|uniref:SAM-dependent methyltransferase n=1 Tax=Nocardia sp. NPDC049707 TaxID=3154735 RepID=UPI00342F1DC4
MNGYTHSPERAHSGRIHSALLGGKDAYSPDFAASERLAAEAKRFQMATRATRLWLLRAVKYLAAEEQVAQFVELGSGYPCAPNVHEMAREHLPAARTLYVDHDPVVASHGRALLADDAQTFFAHADLTDTDTIVNEITTVLDLGAPVAVCLSFVAEFIAEPVDVVDAVTAALPRGSFVALSHVADDIEPGVVKSAAEVYASYGINFRPRSRGEVASLLARCDLVEPGLVAPHRWRPADELDRRRARRKRWEPPQEEQVCCYAAVGKLH